VKIIEINTGFIKLDSLLKFAGITESGGVAKNIISQGDVILNNEKCLIRGKKIYPGDVVKVGDTELEVRGA